MANQRPRMPFPMQITPAMMMAMQQRMRAMGMQPGGMRPPMGMPQAGMPPPMGMQEDPSNPAANEQALGMPTNEQPPAMGMQPQGMGMQMQGMGMQPQGMGMQPQGMGMQPQGMGMQPQGMGMQPQGMGMQPQGMGMQPQVMSMQPQGMGMQQQGMGMQQQGMGMQQQGMGMQPQGMGMQPQGMGMQAQGMGMQQGGMEMQQGFSQQGSAAETAPEEMDGGPMQSTGPELAFIQPTKLFFKPPFGQVSQKIKVKMECQALKGIAFKVRTHRLAHDFYSVKPSQGLIAGGKIDTLVFEMCGGKDENAILAADPKAHSFSVLLLRWPTENKTFDKDVFAKLQAKKGELQTITIDVALKHTPAGTPMNPSTAEGAGGISVQPSKLQFHKPTGTSQFATLTLKNDGPANVAWKTQGNKAAFYVVKPSKGLLAAATSQQIVFEMTPACHPGPGHRFQVTAVPAPDNQHPPPEKWKDAKAQSISIDVEFI